MESIVSPRSGSGSGGFGERDRERERRMGTEVLVLGSGEGVRLVQGGDIFEVGVGVRIEREGNSEDGG